MVRRMCSPGPSSARRLAVLERGLATWRWCDETARGWRWLAMSLSEYAIMFVLVAIMGAGIPGPGDASLIAAGALAGEGKLNIWIVLATAGVAWMLGSVIGFAIGARGGRPLLDHPGRLEGRRRKLLAKGDRAFGRYTFMASATLPAFVSGIFHVRFWLFLLGALTAGIFWIGIYVGVSYFLGAEIAKLVGKVGT